MAWIEIAFEDLQAFAPDISEEKARIMVKDALARAKQIAPHLIGDELDPSVADAASAIIRRAVLRWNDAGTGAIVQKQQGIGPFTQNESYDNRSESKVLFYPSEIEELRALGPRPSTKGKAFSIDMAPNAGTPQSNLWW